MGRYRLAGPPWASGVRCPASVRARIPTNAAHGPDGLRLTALVDSPREGRSCSANLAQRGVSRQPLFGGEYRMRNGARVLLVLAFSAAGAGGLGAQDLAQLCRSAARVNVGQWATYARSGGKDDGAQVRFAIVKLERRGDSACTGSRSSTPGRLIRRITASCRCSSPVLARSWWGSAPWCCSRATSPRCDSRIRW